MVVGLRAVVRRLEEVEVVVVGQEGGRVREGKEEGRVEEELPDVARSAEPGRPAFGFVNV